MNIVIKQARVVDPSSPYNGMVTDIYIANGKIVSIGSISAKKADHLIDTKGLHVSPGWMDLFSDFADPGYEYRETLTTGAAAAAAGGYTDVCVIPNTLPVADQKSTIEYIVQKSKDLPVSIHPLASITRGAEGKELAEMYDMKLSGAVAFSDGTKPLQSSGILLKALQYVKSFNGTIIQVPDDKNINPHGLMNEGLTSTRAGLPGKPDIAEELAVTKEIKLTAYTDSNLHFTGISTAASLKLIKEAKQNKISVSCSVTPHHLFFCDEDLAGYDTNLKVNPPIRNKKDRKALQKAVLDGWVDCIASHHFPYHSDHKHVEFEYAKNGMIGLQTAYSILNTSVAGISQEKCVDLLAINPRKVLGLEIPTITEGAIASLTLFNPNEEWVLQKEAIKSASHNSPYIGKALKGKPVGIIHKGKLSLS